TTRKWLESNLNSGNGNYSLCHGLAGNAEVLLYGSRTLTTGAEDALSLALRVAHAGQVDSVSRGGTWSCGAGGGETPGLMLGLAGIGLFYLRLHDPSVPSALLLSSEVATRAKHS